MLVFLSFCRTFYTVNGSLAALFFRQTRVKKNNNGGNTSDNDHEDPLDAE